MDTRRRVVTKSWLDGEVRDEYSYVYYDYIESTKHVFYIGSGNKNRVLSKRREHNARWLRTTAKHNWRRVVVYESIDREEVYQVEELLIALHWDYGIINNAIYVQHPNGAGMSDYREQYKVVCINTGVEYLSADEASKETDVVTTAISNYCRGNQYYAGDIDDVPLRWRYANSVDKMAHVSDEEILRQRDRLRKKTLTCLNNGLHFDNISAACKKYGLSTGNLSAALLGRVKYCGIDEHGKPMRWQNEEGVCHADGYTDEELLSVNQKKAVIWINTGQRFECLKDAAKATGITAIPKCCNKKSYFAGVINGIPQRWRFEDEGDHSLGKTDKELLTKSSFKPVVCLTTGEIFDTVGAAARSYCIDSSALAKHCKGTNKTKHCGKHPVTGEKLVWEYQKN